MKFDRFVTAAAAWAIVALVAVSVAWAEDAGETVVVTVDLDLGEDVGQNFGTLFEVRSAEGTPLIGAGFVGAYNTYHRTDRRVLHVFERNEARATFEHLPRVNGDAGVYMFDRHGSLFAQSAADGADRAVRRFDPATSRWETAEAVGPDATPVADGLLEVDDRAVRFKGETILSWPEGRGTLGRPYYALGRLVLWNHFGPEDARVERVLAWDWRPGQAGPLSPDAAVAATFDKKGEFLYAMGQLRDDVIVTTNQGSVYRLRGDRWEALRRPDGKSHQVYAALNVGDALWLGHYPSGEVIVYDGESLRPMPGYPPAMPGVSRSSREAQTLTIHGGDVYAGVWPWGEVWRMRPGVDRWGLERRMFIKPEPTAATTHPHEKETAARGPVLNQWGQRITSMVPLGGDLYISTSAKSSKPWSPAFDFLDEEARDEYGRVYRMSRPGQVSALLPWRRGPSRLRVVLGADAIRVERDGLLLAEGPRARPEDRPSADALRRARLLKGKGLYGPARVGSLKVEAKGLAASDPLRGVYIHLDRLLRGNAGPDEGRAAISKALDRCGLVGVNAVMPFANTTSGKALYPSRLLAGRVVEGWSPLAVIKEEAARRGMAFEPVLCVMASGDDRPLGALAERPDWALRDADGAPIGYFSAASPGARDWLTAVVGELVEATAPDALWFDYLRYPNRDAKLDATGQAGLDAALAAAPTDRAVEVAQRFREGELTVLARALAAKAREARPGLRLGIYSWGPHVASGHRVAQPWPVWVDEGVIDVVNVSGYCYRENYGDRFMDEFAGRLAGALGLNRALARPGEVTFALGVRTSHGAVRDAGEIKEYLRVAESLGVDGAAYFAFESLDAHVDALVAEPRP